MSRPARSGTSRGPRTVAAGGGLAAALLLLSGCATAPPAASPPDPEAPFAFRDPAFTLPSGTLGEEEAKRLARGLSDLRSGRKDEAAGRFRRGASSRVPLPFRLGLAYVDLASGRNGRARATLEAILEEAPTYVPAAEARADLDATEGRFRESFDSYRELLAVLPDDPRLARRLGEARSGLLASLRDEAGEALAAGDVATARRAALAAVEVAPDAPDGYRLLFRAAESEGKLEDAWAAAEKARAADPSDAEFGKAVADLAMKTERYADAVEIYEELSRTDPSCVEALDEARFQFQTQNLPEAPRRAALSPRITRAQLAALLWWLVPEVRGARVPTPPEVAVDAVDRAESQALVRAIALGFFPVTRDTHRVGADQPVTRVELAGALRRVALLASGGAPLDGCLAEERPTPAALAECGILPPSSARFVAGREAVRALEGATRAARGGSPR